MAGDFNAAFGHPGFRDLAAGLDDAQRTDGQGWVRTWPFAGNRLPAFVQLDHLLSRGLTVVAAGQVAVNRADHAAVWASYAPAGALTDPERSSAPTARPRSAHGPAQRRTPAVTRVARPRRRAGRRPRASSRSP